MVDGPMTTEPTPTDRELARGITDVPGPEEHDRRYWSVTTLLGVLGSDALIGWAARQAAECGVKQADTWRSIEESSGTLEAIKWVAGARYRPPKGERTAAELGTAVHAAVEEYGLTGRRPAVERDVAPFVDQFEAWCDRWQPTYTATEFSVYSPTYGYAGTCDAAIMLDDLAAPAVGGSRGTRPWRGLIDYKTTRDAFYANGRPKTPYPEAALQLTAYRHAELAAVYRARRFEAQRRRYYLLSDAERELALPVPEVDGCAVLQITPESCELYPVRSDDEVLEAWLAVIDVARFVLQTGLTAVGAPMVRP